MWVHERLEGMCVFLWTGKVCGDISVEHFDVDEVMCEEMFAMLISSEKLLRSLYRHWHKQLLTHTL